MLVKMLHAGMNVARFNFSENDHKTAGEYLENLRIALEQCPDKTCAIMQETSGPEVLLGYMRDNKSVELA